jgi:hypothetical protein
MSDIADGQVWRENGDGLAREIVSNTAGTWVFTPAVEWRRPGKPTTRWCELRRFQKWINDTNATVKA